MLIWRLLWALRSDVMKEHCPTNHVDLLDGRWLSCDPRLEAQNSKHPKQCTNLAGHCAAE